jgi:small subunit ribosomal protein S17
MSHLKEGVVISSGLMNKTVMVAIKRQQFIPKYKYYRWTTSKYMVHDEHNAASIGDRVQIRHCRPYSKNKRWKVEEIIKKYPATVFLEKNPEYKDLKPDKKVERVKYKPTKYGPDPNKVGLKSLA